MKSPLRIVVGAFLVLSSSARARAPQCEAPVEKARAKFAAFVKENRSCRVDADCGVARASCPLACGTVVARASIDEVEKLAGELVQGLDRECQCKGKCGPPAFAVCRDHICVEREARK
jgi:hypothetical protein